MERPDCLIPAAGCSRRMGQWKPVIPFAGRTIIETVVSAALGACGRVIMVTGYRGEELAEIFTAESRVRAVSNPDWELGMFSSLRTGAALVESDRFFICLGDLPFVRTEVYEALLQAPTASAVFPVHGGVRGHPVLLRRSLVTAMLAADPAAGRMKDILKSVPATEVPWPDSSILTDIDFPQDLVPARLTEKRSADDEGPRGGSPG